MSVRSRSNPRNWTLQVLPWLGRPRILPGQNTPICMIWLSQADPNQQAPVGRQGRHISLDLLQLLADPVSASMCAQETDVSSSETFCCTCLSIHADARDQQLGPDLAGARESRGFATVGKSYQSAQKQSRGRKWEAVWPKKQSIYPDVLARPGNHYMAFVIFVTLFIAN